MRDRITLSINPSYLCNLRCEFCYLSHTQLKDPKTISNDVLLDRLNTIAGHRIIEHVDLYGGEIALIREDKLDQILTTIKHFYSSQINVITNLTILNQRLLKNDIDLSVSWDFIAREKHQHVYNNMMSLNKDFHILILASEKLLNLSNIKLDLMIEMLNNIPTLKTVEIKPYSDNSYNRQKIKFDEFERWIIKWIERSHKFNFSFINTIKIKDSLSGNYSSWSDEHLYITPDGDYAVLDFNENDQEFFLKLENYEEYLLWINKERKTIIENSYCKKCEYLGKCLSEHLRPVKSLDHSCNGFKFLLQWYSKNIPN